MFLQHVVIGNFDRNFERKNRAAMFVFFSILTILVMFRHSSVGNDTSNYISIFKQYSNVTWDVLGQMTTEAGFGYFNKIISLVSDNPQFFLAVTAVIVSSMIYPTYKRLCVDASLTILLFVTMSTFVMMFSGIRQMIAIGIGFISYEFTRRKKLIPFIISVIIAIMFHTSAFMLLFMYPLFHAKITKKWLYFVVPVLAVVFVFNSSIFNFLSVIIARFTKYEGVTTSTGAYMMLILFVVFVVFAYIIPDELNLDKETIGLRNFLLLSVVVQMFAPLHTLAMRLSYYYIIFIPLLMPKVIEFRSVRWSQVAVFARHIMVGFFFLYFFLNAYTGSNLHVFPYHFFWESV